VGVVPVSRRDMAFPVSMAGRVSDRSRESFQARVDGLQRFQDFIIRFRSCAWIAGWNVSTHPAPKTMNKSCERNRRNDVVSLLFHSGELVGFGDVAIPAGPSTFAFGRY